MELATFIIYHRWFDGISLALFGVTRIMPHGQAISTGIILIVDRSIAPRTGCAIGCNPETNAIGRVSIRHLAIRIGQAHSHLAFGRTRESISLNRSSILRRTSYL